jgi:hypothetical protein
VGLFARFLYELPRLVHRIRWPGSNCTQGTAGRCARASDERVLRRLTALLDELRVLDAVTARYLDDWSTLIVSSSVLREVDSKDERSLFPLSHGAVEHTRAVLRLLRLTKSGGSRVQFAQRCAPR